jgi:D-aminopeptidase
MPRARLRELGIRIGTLPPGPHNAITDVAGVLVGHHTLIYDQPRVARTGVTVIVPRGGEIWKDAAFAGFHSYNGAGEMTGVHWIDESGLLGSPIALTNTHQVGLVRDTLIGYAQEKGLSEYSALPVVGETYDGGLNDLDGFHVRPEHVLAALTEARSGPVAEGSVGGGTGMICHDFKGGIGTASRQAEIAGIRYTVGALVQANHGSREDLRVDGVPVGRELDLARIPGPWPSGPPGGSLLVVLATDAPLVSDQCRRLARRATLGMARCGGIGHNTSGDLFLAFAVGNHVPVDSEPWFSLRMLAQQELNPLFYAAAESVEEAIVNCLTAADTMTGFGGRTVYGLPLEELQSIWSRYRPTS